MRSLWLRSGGSEEPFLGNLGTLPEYRNVTSNAQNWTMVLEQCERAPGRYTTRWNGRDDEGRRLAAGVYFYSLDAGERRLSRKVVLTSD